MDFTNRGQQFQPKEDNEPRQHSPPQSQHGDPGRGKNIRLPHRSKLLRVFQAGLLLAVAVLMVGILLSIATYERNGEDDYVDTSKVQAVFLNGGQVYFGKITDINKDYLVLSNIYYLRVTQQVQPGQENQQNNFTLAKLGCELHRPTDVMVVNKEQIIFWENLKDEDGANTVTGAIKQYQQTTNGEQNCEQQQQNTGGGSNTPEPNTTTNGNTGGTNNTTNGNATTDGNTTNNNTTAPENTGNTTGNNANN